MPIRDGHVGQLRKGCRIIGRFFAIVSPLSPLRSVVVGAVCWRSPGPLSEGKGEAAFGHASLPPSLRWPARSAVQGVTPVMCRGACPCWLARSWARMLVCKLPAPTHTARCPPPPTPGPYLPSPPPAQFTCLAPSVLAPGAWALGPGPRVYCLGHWLPVLGPRLGFSFAARIGAGSTTFLRRTWPMPLRLLLELSSR